MTPPASKRAPQAAIDGRVSGPVPVQRSGRSGRGRVARSAAAHTFRYSTSQQGASGARAPANQGGGRAHTAAPAASGRATRAPAARAPALGALVRITGRPRRHAAPPPVFSSSLWQNDAHKHRKTSCLRDAHTHRDTLAVADDGSPRRVRPPSDPLAVRYSAPLHSERALRNCLNPRSTA